MTFMTSTSNIPLQIQKLLLENTVMSLEQLRHEFVDRSQRTLSRDLKKLDVISSYTHTGQYHVLKKNARFDKNGFWFFRDIGFSQYGTLKKTLMHRISHVQIGMIHKEIRPLFRVAGPGGEAVRSGGHSLQGTPLGRRHTR